MNERETRDLRERLYDDLANDRTTPEKAEAKARELELEPLTPTLDPTRFDPMRETHWTLAMTVAWIAWRDLDYVRDCLPRWREQHQSWTRCDYTVGDGDGDVLRRTGWLLEQTHKGEAPLLFLSICEAVEASEGAAPGAAQRVGIHEAQADLWAKLGGGELTAITMVNGAPVQIRAHEWPFLRRIEQRGADVLRAGRDMFTPATTYNGNDVLLRRDDVLRLWPAQAPKRRGRKPSVGPAAKIQIDAMRAEGLAVDTMSEKALARALESRGVSVQPRSAGRARRA